MSVAPANELPPDVVAAWPAMCAPVQQRYAAEGRRDPGRRLTQRGLEWLAARTGVRRRPDGEGTLPAEARILAIRPDHLGDALLTTPAFGLLKAALPGAHVTVLAGPWAQEVPAHCPAVDQVRVVPLPGFTRTRGGRAPWQRAQRVLGAYALLYRTAGAIAEGRYDLAINFRADYGWGAALAALAGIPHRLGYATPDTSPFLTRALPLVRVPVGKNQEADAPHAVELNLALARAALSLAARVAPADFAARMAFEPTAAERAAGWQLWRANDLEEHANVVAIHPMPGEPVKRWPAKRFALVADHLAGRYGARILITGGPGDVEEARAVAAQAWRKPVVLAGQTSFGVQAALLDRCRFVIGTDNGALHLASARGRPTLRIYGPTDARVWGAWPRPSIDPGAPAALTVASPRRCSPCHRLDVPAWEVATGEMGGAYPCLQEVSVEQVIDAAERLWSLTEGGR